VGWVSVGTIAYRARRKGQSLLPESEPEAEEPDADEPALA
jgi:hypothetical protein